jgi:cytochrome c551/c552
LLFKIYILLIVSLLVCNDASSQSCEINGRRHYDFQDIKQILDKNKCNSCHQNPTSTTSWTYNTYADLNNATHCNQLIIAHGYPNQSLLIDKINGGPTACGNAMPLGSQKVSNTDLIAIEAWIEIGAPEFCLTEFEQIKKIFIENKCMNCHNQNIGWTFDSYSSIFSKPEESVCDRPEIVKHNAENSLLYQKIAGKADCGLNMPVEGTPMSNGDIAKIRDWINAGAPESSKALPVSLSEFNTLIDKNGYILLYWETASEINTSHFDIEFSRDGIHFEKVGEVDALGSELSGKQYQFMFEYSNIGYHYFRLKINDYDSKFTYSAIRVEKIENSIEVFNMLPNPVHRNSIFTVEWYPTDDREKVKLLLVSINGQLKNEFILNSGINQIELSAILPGVYYLSIEDYFTVRKIKKLVILDF